MLFQGCSWRGDNRRDQLSLHVHCQPLNSSDCHARDWAGVRPYMLGMHRTRHTDRGGQEDNQWLHDSGHSRISQPECDPHSEVLSCVFYISLRTTLPWAASQLYKMGDHVWELQYSALLFEDDQPLGSAWWPSVQCICFAWTKILSLCLLLFKWILVHKTTECYVI